MPTVENLMTRDPACCLPDEGVIECARLMASNNVGVIPVVESRDTRRLVGVVTDRDLCVSVVAEGRNPEEVFVDDCMTDNVVTCRPGDDLDEALRLMAEHRLRRILVVDDSGCCVGVLSQADVARAAPPTDLKRTVEKISSPERGTR